MSSRRRRAARGRLPVPLSAPDRDGSHPPAARPEIPPRSDREHSRAARAGLQGRSPQVRDSIGNAPVREDERAGGRLLSLEVDLKDAALECGLVLPRKHVGAQLHLLADHVSRRLSNGGISKRAQVFQQRGLAHARATGEYEAQAGTARRQGIHERRAPVLQDRPARTPR